jgi:LacI family transcriptional regulator
MSRLSVPTSSSRPVTLEKLASACSLSVATASLALNRHPRVAPETQERVLETARRLGYFGNLAARRLSQSRVLNRRPQFDQVSLVVIDLENRPLGSDYVAFLQGAEYQASEWGASLLFSRIVKESDWNKVERLTRTGLMDGFLLVGVVDDAVARQVRAFDRPWVVLGNQWVSHPVHQVTFDFAALVPMGIDYLRSQGHRRIGFIGGRPGFRFPHQKILQQEFVKSVAAAGLATDQRLIRNESADHGILEPLIALLKLGATGIFFAESGHIDRTAALMDALELKGRKDLGFFFFDIHPRPVPGHQSRLAILPCEKLGSTGIQLLKQLCETPDDVVHSLIIAPELAAC